MSDQRIQERHSRIAQACHMAGIQPLAILYQPKTQQWWITMKDDAWVICSGVMASDDDQHVNARIRNAVKTLLANHGASA